jgi:LysM repeat protein
MNNSNPFVPQGSLLDQQNKRRSRMKLGVFCVLAVSVTGLLAMLIQGCKREPAETTDNTLMADTTNTTAMDNSTNVPSYSTSNSMSALPPMATSAPPVAVAPPVVETATTEYVVVKNDTLAKIAKKNNVSLKALKAANPDVVPTKLKVGQKLSLPAPSAVAPTAAATTMADAGVSGETYTVKSGDNLSKIAKAYGTTFKAIESLNNLTTTKIKVGQKLKIPAKAEAAATAPTPAVESTVAPPTPPAPSAAPVTPMK